MPRKVGIIGAGKVGSMTAAYLIEQNNCDGIYLYDKNLDKAQAHALDLIDTLAFTQSYVRVFATDDIASLSDMHVIVNALGSESCVLHQEHAHLMENGNAVREIFPRLMEAGFDGLILNISSPNESLTQLIQEVTGLPHKQVFGTGTYIDTLRLYRIMSLALQINPCDFEGFVLGAHVVNPVIVWSSLCVSGRSLEHLSDPDDFDQEAITDSLHAARTELIKGKAGNSIGISKLTSQLIGYIFSSSNRILPIATYHPEYGTYVSSPVILSRYGVKRRLPQFFQPEEQTQFDLAVEAIKALHHQLVTYQDTPEEDAAE